MLAIERKTIFIYYLFPNILKYEMFVKNSVDCVILLSLFCLKKFYGYMFIC